MTTRVLLAIDVDETFWGLGDLSASEYATRQVEGVRALTVVSSTTTVDAVALPLTTAEIPADWPVQPVNPHSQTGNPTTCGECYLTWDDAVSTSLTPAPGARCPFEPFHHTPGAG